VATIVPHTTRAIGTVLTAAIYNFDHVNHDSNDNALNVELAAIGGIGSFVTTDIAAAATCDIGAAPTSIVRITGAVGPITSFGTVANSRRFVFFNSTPQINHNAVSLILPGAANKIAAAGDCAIFISDAAGNWRCHNYQEAATIGGALSIGTTPITGGVAARILYNNTGFLGEYTISGTGSVVAMATSPSLVTPLLGTPASGNLVNCVGLPINAGTTGVLEPDAGGTGVSNNNASTLAIIGSFSTSLTVTAVTSVTLPVSGTLATLAGLEELTNKTLNASVAKGVWSTSGVWTVPAFTLAGTISGGGNQINNVIIGAVTPLAGSFTTVSHSSYAEFDEIASPSNPAANKLRVFAKDVAGVTHLFTRESGGGEVDLSAAAGGSAGLILLASGSISAAGNLDIVLTGYTGYRALLFVLQSFVPVTDDTILYMRFSTDGGSSYIASGYAYTGMGINDGGGSINSSSGSAAQAAITSAIGGTNGVSNVATEGGAHAEIWLFDQTAAANFAKAKWHSTWYIAAAQHAQLIGSCTQEVVGDVDAIRFLFSSGNIASGKYAVYGLS